MKNSKVQLLAAACIAVLGINPVYSSVSTMTTTDLPAGINSNHPSAVQIAQAGINVDIPGASISVGGDGRIRINSGDTRVNVDEGVQVNTGGHSSRRTTTLNINNDSVTVIDETGNNVHVGEGGIRIGTGVNVGNEGSISIWVEEGGAADTGNGCSASGGRSYANQNLSIARR